jgi:hypothetical protein
MRIAMGCLLTAALAACGGMDSGGGGMQAQTGSDGGRPSAPSFRRDVVPILEGCSTAYCHPGRYSPMSLRAADAYEVLVGVPSEGCDGERLRVTPGDDSPERSDLVAKLTGVAMCGGKRMPKEGPALSDAQIAVVRAWIAAGAHND